MITYIAICMITMALIKLTKIHQESLKNESKNIKEAYDYDFFTVNNLYILYVILSPVIVPIWIFMIIRSLLKEEPEMSDSNMDAMRYRISELDKKKIRDICDSIDKESKK